MQYTKKRTSRKPFTVSGVEWLSYQVGVNSFTLHSTCERARVWRPSHRMTWRASIEAAATDQSPGAARISELERQVNDLKLHYIGACSLLARIGGRDLDDGVCAVIKEALDECAVLADMQVVAVASKVGWALEPKTR